MVARLRPGLRRSCAALLLAAGSYWPAHAAEDPELERVRDRLAQTLPEVKREDVRRSDAPGLFEVRVGHAFGYVTADGRYLVAGGLTDLDSGEAITDRRVREERLRTVGAFQDGAIVFAPSGEEVKYWVTVFTDVDCEYCRMLHREVPEMNRRGVGVRYLFYSKDGAPSEAYTRAQQVWCDDDRNAALTRGLLQHKVAERHLCRNPVIEQYLAAKSMNLRGTPVAILPNGEILYGYLPAEKLLQKLEELDQPAAEGG